MKISIDIDCTPEEARAFLGLPDVKPMQEAAMAALQEQLRHGIEQTDPETLMKTWLAPGLEGFTRMQEAMWNAATGKAAGDEGTKKR